MSTEHPEVFAVGYVSTATDVPKGVTPLQAALRCDRGRLERVLAISMERGLIFDSAEVNETDEATPGVAFLDWLQATCPSAVAHRWDGPAGLKLVGFYPRSLVLLATHEALQQGRQAVPHLLDQAAVQHLPNFFCDNSTGSLEQLGNTLRRLLGREDLDESFRPCQDAELDLSLTAELAFRLGLCDNVAKQMWQRAVEPAVPTEVVTDAPADDDEDEADDEDE